MARADEIYLRRGVLVFARAETPTRGGAARAAERIGAAARAYLRRPVEMTLIPEGAVGEFRARFVLHTK